MPSLEAVASVLESKNGLLKGIDQNKPWIEMGTADSQELLRLAKLMGKRLNGLRGHSICGLLERFNR